MKKIEKRSVVVTYCDVCGSEIVGNMTVFNAGTPDEKHACHVWIEIEETRCDLKFQDNIDKKSQSPTSGD